jgi:hypothetical protein
MKSLPGNVVLAAILAVTVLYGVPQTPSAVAQGAWYGEYFANPHLAGGPVLTRYDDTLHFEWGLGSPGAGVPADNFSARWTREEWFEAGTYRFSYRSDDGIRIWVGDTLVVDDWRDRQAAWSFSDHVLPGGTHRVRVEYYERGGAATVQVGWERVSGGTLWRGEYFSNRTLSGSPALVRADPAIDFDWGDGSPDPALPPDNFSVRWSRTLGFEAGTYRFYSSTDDGVRVYVDGYRIIDAWHDQKLPNTHTGDMTLANGQHTILVEYYEHGGEASAHVWWNRLGAFGGWEGRYYDNAELRGGPALIRDDAEINFDWGEGAPASWMPSDNFSAVWTRQVSFSPGYYRLNVRSDDGIRVWLDDSLVMDYWRPLAYEWHYLDATYLQGPHRLKVEYFERTGEARVRFWWELIRTAPSVTPAPGLPGPWTGAYFNNTNLAGEPALVRGDAALDFNWGQGSPAPEIDRDFFSARWTGTFHFASGRYTFNTYSDDGVRLFIDDRLVIDSWRPMRGYRSTSLNLSEGAHTVRLEYFERTGVALVRLSWGPLGGTLPVEGRPGVCAGGPLRLDAWPVATTCTAGGWKATIFVEGHGGDCRYTYAWERQVQGVPTSRSMTFDVFSAGYGTAIVGEASLTSAGQTVKVGLHIPHPTCP